MEGSCKLIENITISSPRQKGGFHEFPLSNKRFLNPFSAFTFRTGYHDQLSLTCKADVGPAAEEKKRQSSESLSFVQNQLKNAGNASSVGPRSALCSFQAAETTSVNREP